MVSPEADTGLRSRAGTGPRAAAFAPSRAAIGFGAAHESRYTLRLREACIRLVNCAIALSALVVAVPLLLVTAIAILATSRGPIIYRQSRVGLDRRRTGSDRRARASLEHRRLGSAELGAEPPTRRRGDRREVDAGGRIFTIYKFRTMRTNAHAAPAVWATSDDARVTSIDDVRRKTAMDLDDIARRSLVEDLRIMVRTVPVMILRKGAH